MSARSVPYIPGEPNSRVRESEQQHEKRAVRVASCACRRRARRTMCKGARATSLPKSSACLQNEIMRAGRHRVLDRTPFNEHNNNYTAISTLDAHVVASTLGHSTAGFSLDMREGYAD